MRTEAEKSALGDENPRRPSALVRRVETQKLFLRGEELADGLGNTEGVYVRRDSSYGQSAFLTVRGGNSRQVPVFFDGFRISAPQGLGFDLGRLALDGIEEAQVFRGAGAALYGGGAVTGALALQPVVQTGDEPLLRGRFLAGSFGTAALSMAGGGGSERLGAWVYGGARRSEGAFPFVDGQGVDHERLNNDHFRQHVGTTLHSRIGAHRFRLSALLEEGEAGNPGLSEFQRQFQYARVADRRRLLVGRWEHSYGSPEVGVDSFLTFGVQQKDYAYQNREAFLGGGLLESEGEELILGARGGASFFLGNHILVAEAELRQERYQDPDLESSRETLGVTVGDEWLLFEDRLSLVGALRLEPARVEEEIEVVGPFPALGFVWRALPWLRLQGNGARTFRRPDFDELFLDTEGVRGNRELRPEEAWSLDFGLLFAPAPTWEILAGVYAAFFDSMILFLPVSAYLFEAQNLEDAVTRGVELAVKGDLGGHRVMMSYTHTDAFFAALPGVQLPQQPRHRGFVEGQSIPLPVAGQPSFRAALHARSALNHDRFGNLKNAGFARVDLGVNFKLHSSIGASLQVQNLFDHRRSEDSLQRPLPGRTVYFTVQLEPELSRASFQ